MMELTCAFILVLASSVAATPYGYGVKGGAGASARAESSASAGAFGGVGEVPVAVPLGAGFSGSFSKSSSSSSSSSSASSSSSSFSYSGTGGVSGYSSNGGTQGNVGCLTGNCLAAGTNGIHTPHGSSIQGYNAANAAATAGAGALTGSGCQGSSCDYNSGKCASGQCNPKTQTGISSSNADKSKCASGQCGSTLQSGTSPTQYGDNDIHVGFGSSDSSHSSHDKTSNIDDISHYGSDCSQGNCGPSVPSNSKPPYSHGSGDVYQGSNASDKQYSYNLNAGTGSNYNKPATHLETPKFDSKCNSANCNPAHVAPGHENSPSSYNVPIHGSYDSNEKKPGCDGVKCENQPKRTHSSITSDSLSINYLSPQPSLSIDNTAQKEPSSINIASSPNCKGSNCFGIPSSHIASGPTLTVGPGNIQFGQPTYNAPGSSSTNCNTPNCSPNPAGPGSLVKSDVPFGSIGHIKHNDAFVPTDDKFLAYTGGFGGPAGILRPNEFDVVSTPTGKPDQTHISSPQNVPSFESPSTGCNSPSCSGYPSSGSNTHSGTFAQKPASSTSSSSTSITPSDTGSFSRPAGTLKPNEFNIHTTLQQVTNKPNYAHPVDSSYNTLPSSSNIGTAGCKTPNCNGYSPTVDATVGVSATSGHGTYGPTKPNSSSSSEKVPTYTGGFGGPAGALKPHDYDMHSTVSNSQTHILTGSHNTPFGSSNSAGCKTPNCYPSNVDATGAANAQAESLGVAKPSYGPHYSSAALPAYTSGNNKPFGATKPHEISVPALAPSFTNTQSPPSPVSHPTGCKTGNCATYPNSGALANANAQSGSFTHSKPNTDTSQSGPNLPQYTSSFGGPSGVLKPNDHSYDTPTGVLQTNCKTSNCGNSPTASVGTISGAIGQSGSFAHTKPSTDSSQSGSNLPQYTSSFGGPSGILKPNSHLYDTPTGIAQTQCKTSNCGNSPTASVGTISGAIGQSGSFAHTKPNTDSSQSEPNLPQYTGSFGGPPGVLKPSDHSYDTPTGIAQTNCKTSNCGNAPTVSVGAISGAIGQSGSFAHTKPNTDSSQSEPNLPQYTGSFGGPPGVLKPSDHSYDTPTGIAQTNCKTSNCGNAPTVSVGAISGAIGQSGSFAVPKPGGSDSPSNEKLPTYTGGFGGASGLLKPNDYTVLAVNPTNKPLAPTGVSKPTVCTSGNCNLNVPQGSPSDSHNDASNGVHTSATVDADASAVLYTGGFGGPPGVLKPYDDGKVGVAHGHPHGSQSGTPDSSHNANIQSPHSTSPGFISGTSSNAGTTGHVAADGNTGAQAGSIADSAAYSGAAAGAAAGGSSYGYNTHGSYYNKAGSSKGGSPCGAGCGAGGGGDGANYDYNSGLGVSRFRDLEGLNGGRSVALAKSIAGSSAIGLGGSFASSSASAHASAGAYTKGGYGKR